MNEAKIVADYKRLRQAFPSSILSKERKYLLIPELRLPKRFNPRKTPMLIKLHPESDYLAPEAYVDRRLRVNSERSHHLDECLTESELLERGWVKLCVQVNWHPSFSLVDYLIMAIKFLEGLSE